MNRPLVVSTGTSLRAGVRPPRQHRRIETTGLRVRERPLNYEDEGSERHSLGAVSVGNQAWWSVALTVPDGADQAEALFLRFERHGVLPPGYRGGVVTDLTLPRAELDAIVVLLSGIAAQARRDGLLPARET